MAEFTHKPVEIYGKQTTGTATAILVDSSGKLSLSEALTTVIGDINDITGTISELSGKQHTSTIPVTFATSSTIITVNGGVSYAMSQKNFIFTAAQASTAIWTASAGKRFTITDLIISASTSLDLTLIDNTSTLITFYFDNRGGAVSNFNTPIQSSTITGALRVTTTASTCSILVTGYEA